MRTYVVFFEGLGRRWSWRGRASSVDEAIHQARLAAPFGLIDYKVECDD